MSIDYQRYRFSNPKYTIKSLIHPSLCFSFICNTLKRLLKQRFTLIYSCSKILNSKQKKVLRRNLCKFAYNYYFIHFARQFNLNLRDKTVRIFFSQLSFWICNRFSKKTIPDAYSSINN